jgi:hypothetical protein
MIYDRIIPLLAFGKITEEYYEKDNSARVVFRIEKKNLLQTIDSIDIKLKKEEPKGESR